MSNFDFRYNRTYFKRHIVYENIGHYKKDLPRWSSKGPQIFYIFFFF